MISAVVVTYNEKDKLLRCIESIESFCDEIIVIDLESSEDLDDLKKIKKLRLISHSKVGHVELIRQWSINQTKYDWVLVLDPDEIVPKKLAEKLISLIKQSDYIAVNIPRKNIFFGSWISHSNFWPDRQIRFFKKNQINWPTKIHTYPQISGKVLDLPKAPELALEHYGYQSYQEFIKRQIRYAKVEAEYLREVGQSFSVFNLFWKPIREILVRFFKHRGFLDGLNGIFIVVALVYHQILIQYYLLKDSK